MKLPYFLKNPTDQLVLTGVGSVISGFALGYIWAKKRYSETIAVASDIIEDMLVEDNQMAFPIMEKPKPKFVPLDLAAVSPVDSAELTLVVSDASVLSARNEHPTNYNRPVLVPETEVVDEPTVTLVRSVFDGETTEWNYELEANNRTDTEPYVLHYEEYMGDEMGFKQSTFTYYEGDDIMADEHDKPVYNHAGMMGALKFGHGSNDANVVYIRNEALRMEWEVLKHTGSFSMEVLGEHFADVGEQELRHSVGKFRRE